MLPCIDKIAFRNKRKLKLNIHGITNDCKNQSYIDKTMEKIDDQRKVPL